MSEHVASSPDQNPFPGPQPYRTADRDRFFGREEVAQKLADRIFVHPALTLYGPSGAGKSSLMAAGVIPLLEEEHDMRVVRVDTWPAGEVPLLWLTRALFEDLELGAVSEGKSGPEALDEAMRLSRLQSDRPILLYLDQLEQVLLPGRDAGEAAELFDGLDGLASRASRGLHLVLALREDYLGRLRDRARGRKALLDQGFRLGPLTVGEMVNAVLAAAQKGAPPQEWDKAETRRLMLEVRVAGESPTDEAEAQAAFGQIVCRALWGERSQGTRSSHLAGPQEAPRDAERILRRYLDETVASFGKWQAEARRLLEEHLIDREGNRRPLTEKEARAALSAGAADEVLRRLEQEAVLRAEEHQGSRYFELGHDWLAKRVFEQREERKQKEARAREEREREESERKRREEERAARRRLGIIAGVAVAVAVVMGVVVVWALGQRDAAQKAEREATDARNQASQNAELAEWSAEEARKNAEEARTQKAAADRARDKQKMQAEQYQRDLSDLNKKIEKATLEELKKIQLDVQKKSGSVLTLPPGIGGAVPPPP